MNTNHLTYVPQRGTKEQPVNSKGVVGLCKEVEDATNGRNPFIGKENQESSEKIIVDKLKFNSHE